MNFSFNYLSANQRSWKQDSTNSFPLLFHYDKYTLRAKTQAELEQEGQVFSWNIKVWIEEDVIVCVGTSASALTHSHTFTQRTSDWRAVRTISAHFGGPKNMNSLFRRKHKLTALYFTFTTDALWIGTNDLQGSLFAEPSCAHCAHAGV